MSHLSHASHLRATGNPLRWIATLTLSFLPLAGFAAPAIWFPLGQTPITGNLQITNTATTNTTFWGTLSGSGALPTVVAGARTNIYTTNAWQFNGGYYLADGPNAVTKSLGDITNTAGFSEAFWVHYTSQLTDQWVRLCALGGSGEAFDVSIQNAGSGVGLGTLMFCFGYVDATGGRTVALTTPTAVLNGAWHQCVLTVDFRRTNNNAILYVDGAEAASSSSVIPNSFTTPNSSVDIGARGDGSPWHGGSLDQFILYTNALQAAEVTQLYSLGTVTNYAPVVMLSPRAATLQWTNGVNTNISLNLAANITDDGQPYGLLTNVWTVTSGPVGTLFSSPTNAATTATFTNLGAYVLRCTASDGALFDYDEVTVVVATNAPPVIGYLAASPATMLNTNPTTVALTAWVTDDGLPNPPGMVTNLWSFVSGPAGGSVVFANHGTNASTTATVSTNVGTYVLQLLASDSQLTTTSSVTVTVASNLGPASVLSVDTQTITWPSNSTTLRAVITDDANPPRTVTNLWLQWSGPNAAALATPGANNCALASLIPGQYVFACVAGDGQMLSTNTTYVTVWSPGVPIVNAGSSRTVWLPNGTIQLQGSYAATTGLVSVAWSLRQGPGGVVFSAPNSLATAASFSRLGKYVVQLTVTNGIFVNADSLVVEVYDSATGNFGYTPGLFYNWTNDLNLTYDYTGLNWSRIKPPPPAYRHPRLLLNPEDVPDLRARLTSTTAVGPILMNTIRTTITNNLTGAGVQWRAAYDQLAEGITTDFDALPGTQEYLAGTLAYECFRCLIDNDAVGGAKAGAALATIANEKYAYMTANPSTDWRNANSGTIYYQFMAYGYDFDYNFMTPGQQSAVRQMLALATSNQWSIGMDALPSLGANSSNWINNNALYLLLDVLAIEGETGCDTNCLPRLQACYDRFFTMGAFSEGALYEGMGKGSLYTETVIALAKRGILLAASTTAKNYVRQFHLHCLETTGYGWTWDELLGSSFSASKYADLPVFKYLYPNDPLMDFMARNDLGANWTSSSWLTSINLDFMPDVPVQLVRAICAQDFNTNLTFVQALTNQVAPNAPLSCFFNNRGLLISRSDWTTNGSRLFFQPRSEPGGHSMPDRNSFDFSALGRIWAPELDGWATPADMSTIASVMRVDNVGPSTMPAAVVDFADTPNFTYAAGNASDCYNYQYGTTVSGGGTATPSGPVVSFTVNQKRMFTNSAPWMNLPWGVLADWQFSTADTTYWTNNVPVQRAFRTAGLGRGTDPYALIVDDIQAGNTAHAYDWRMILASDLTNVTFTATDAIFASPINNAKLLVRLLRTSAAAYSIQTNSYTGQLALDILATNIAPDFKVLLLPFTNATLPVTTTWSSNVLTITMNDGQTDQIFFSTNAGDGRTRVSEYRIAGQGAVLSAPANLTASAASGKVNLQWNAVTGASGYNLKVANVSGGPYSVIASNLTATVFTNFVVNGLNYFYVVAAVSTNGESELSNEAGASPVGAPPVPALTAVSSNAAAILSWTASFGATGYNLGRATNPGGPYTLAAANLNATMFLDTGLTNGWVYYYVVSALGANGQSADSAEAVATPLTPPAAPAGLVAVAGNLSVALSWNPVFGATSYNVQRATTSGGPYATIFPGFTGTNLTDYSAYNGVTYFYVVSGVNAGGVGANSAQVSALPTLGGSHTPANLIWQGDNSANVWDQQDTGNLVWLNHGTNVAFWNGDTVTFNDSGSESPALNLVIPVAPAGVVEFNATNSYTISGAGKITGSCGLQKDGGGMLTILNTNDFTGSLTVNAGTLQIGDGGNGGQHLGAIALTGGSLTVNRSDNFALAASLSGASTNSAINNTSGSGALTLALGAGSNVFSTIKNSSPVNALTLGGAGSTNVFVGALSIAYGPLVFNGSVCCQFPNPGFGNGDQSGKGAFTVSGAGTEVSLGAGRYLCWTNITVDGGTLMVAGDRFGPGFAAGANTITLTTNTGTILVTTTSYGSRLGCDSAAGAPNNSITINQNGGTYNQADAHGINLGGTSANTTNLYNLAGGTLIAGSGGITLGADTGGTSTTALTLSGTGALIVSGTIQGNQGAGARQNLVFNGGTLVAGTVSMTKLTAAGPTAGTATNLVNNGGVLAPGGLGTPGKTTITGNYTVSSSAASLAIDIGGTSQASSFTNAANNYDFVSVSGTATLGGNLSVSLINNYQSSITTNNSFTVLTASGGVSGMFANVVNGRVAAANVPGGSFVVMTNATSVILTNYAVLSAPPVLGGLSIVGGNLVITGTNGTAGANYLVLATTNLSLPVTNWNSIATQQFGPGGSVNFTNPQNPNAPPTFYRLRLP